MSKALFGVLCFSLCRQVVGNTGRTAAQGTQEVQLGSSYLTDTSYLNLRNIRRIQREYTFYAFAERNFANSERRVQTIILTGNADAFINLNTLAVAFLYLGVNLKGCLLYTSPGPRD